MATTGAVQRVYEILFSVAFGVPDEVVFIWRKVREVVLVPAMKIAVIICLIMSVMVFIEKLVMGAVSLYVKVFHRKPEKIYKWEALREDVEIGTSVFPMVLVQIPMFNEKEVYKLSIEAACNLTWPSDRVIIQVLDDSTDPVIKGLVRNECEKWLRKGKNIRYETRNNRNGYKAGALKEGMKYNYVQTCDYIAMFDADFQPSPDFLMRTVPFLVHNDDVALVQARWKFVNARECLMTRVQEMSMDYHFKVEQESGSSTFAFFGFNGTAGVWRIKAIDDSGGWNDRTTVEDMDLAVRAGLGGWKFIYVGDIKVNSELPSTLKAYRYQQHRWSCGPANLLRKMAWEIILAEKVSFWKKFYVIYNFFLARRIISHYVTFFFYSIVIPLAVFFPELYLPKWCVVYIPTAITLLNSVGTPSSFHLIIFWVLLENVMSLHRCKAVFIGLLEAGRANEWVVTEKLGDMLKTKPDTSVTKKFQIRFWKRFHVLELVVSVFLLISASYNLINGGDIYYIYIFPQAMSFFLVGIGYVGTFIPTDK
ncbi:beta-mannan synthase protein [Dioscorea alata]|uniref:Beta-mannan synthase protein n=1 Tax=Dioscorea alata TaxID=55571 RepID=A0ACB7W8S3_DIOAL|nr:beta-mannan synthase protein [Dioscorea alata]